MRECRGSSTATNRPEVQTIHDTVNGKLVLTLSNTDSNQTCTLIISDNAYGSMSSMHTLVAGQSLRLDYSLSNSFGWYDFSVSSSNDTQFLRRLAGHVEATANNNFNSRCDPRIGGKRSAARLSSSTPQITRGSNITVTYEVAQAKLSTKNWIGVYAVGVVPGTANSLAWQYASSMQGNLTLNTANLATGNYMIWYLYNDAYTALAAPLALTIV